MIKILKTDWKTSQNKLKTIREIVFIKEQQVPVELEWDNEDAGAIHLLAINTDGLTGNEPVGTSRIIINNDHARIGRMAVLKKWRNNGIGSELLQDSLTICKQEQVHDVFIHAQEYIVPFYEQAGFQVVGDRFMDAGIPHKKMHIQLRFLQNC
jgi:predicted GNAT family N-acyltransferase